MLTTTLKFYFINDVGYINCDEYLFNLFKWILYLQFHQTNECMQLVANKTQMDTLLNYPYIFLKLFQIKIDN